jgi:D-arabinose 1-dehydrogenase-like Zn-dependent alcohol dehydrogenase
MRAAVAPAVHTPWEIRASGLCYTALHVSQGRLPITLPHTSGHEPTGEVVAVSAGVRTRRVGDRVGVPWIQASKAWSGFALSSPTE